MSFDYFYNREAEQYIHYTLPKLLFENEELKKLSINAKFLYCILLDRAKSSYKNGFIDEDGKVYLHFAQADIMKLLGCGRTKVSDYFSELDEPKGVGLIERKQKIGIGKSDRIYVKNFARPIDNTCRNSDDVSPYSRFAYFHDMESMKFENYQVPKTLFLDEEISKISNTAKMVYSIMLDRTKLSMSKGWQDSEGRIYILFPQKELQQLLGCSIKTVRSALKELDIKDGVGLIDRTRQGMNNPDIIYLLDYSTALKYAPKTKEKSETEHPNVENLNIGEEKSEHPDGKNMNTGGEKSEHRDRQNVNIGGEKSERIIYNNTESNNTDFSDTDSINQSFAYADGQTDRTQQENDKIPFWNIMTDINAHEFAQHYFNLYKELPEDESCLWDYDERKRDVYKCNLPYSLKSNPQAMREALKFIFSYSSYYDDSDKETRILLDTVIKSIVEMLKNDYCILDKQTVKYYQIIDIINDIMHNSSPMEWLYSFKSEWSQILSERRRDIGNSRAYIKTCIWNSLSDFQFKENNDSLQADYDYEHGFPNSRGRLSYV
ncbi:MAG: replication initiator protein A [Ruminococcus sp.]|nr:replication initiator protein A [Ruminococcus sp.]